jgi:hypothetical protein
MKEESCADGQQNLNLMNIIEERNTRHDTRMRNVAQTTLNLLREDDLTAFEREDDDL